METSLMVAVQQRDPKNGWWHTGQNEDASSAEKDKHYQWRHESFKMLNVVRRR